MRRKTLSYLGVILMVVGLALVVHYGYGVVYARFHQDRLMREAQASWENPVVSMEDRPITPPRPSVDEAEEPEEEEVLPADDGPFIILIPKIEIEAVVLDGVDLDTLAQGPGFYPDNPRPGADGNVAVAGHRTTYGAWFRNVDQLEEGDEIVFSSPVAEYRYLVEDVYPVASNAWEVVDPTEEPKLTLTTCHPPGSASQRLVVRAGLDGVERK
ncbi:MAG: class E sortase [Bacillota bacterium]